MLSSETTRRFIETVDTISKRAARALASAEDPTSIVQKMHGEYRGASPATDLNIVYEFWTSLLEIKESEVGEAIRHIALGSSSWEGGEEVLVKETLHGLLDAATLCLFFLGIHFSHAGAGTRRNTAAELSYPSGIWSHKACGDVYRRARKIAAPESQVLIPIDQPQVLVLTDQPIFLDRYEEIVAKRRSGALASAGAIHGLGFLYNLLQFRLVLSAKLTIQYFIYSGSFQSSRLQEARSGPFRELFGEPKGDRVAFVVTDQAGRLSARVLGGETGLCGLPMASGGSTAGCYHRESGADLVRQRDEVAALATNARPARDYQLGR